MVRVATLALLVASAGRALAQPGDAASGPPPALADVLAGIAGRDWEVQVTGDRGVFRRPDASVAFEVAPACGSGFDLLPTWDELAIYRRSSAQPGRFCLQLETQVLLLDIGDDRTFSANDPDRFPLLQTIAGKLRPPVPIPLVGVLLRSSLFLSPTDDGFVTHGAVNSRISISTDHASCSRVSYGPSPKVVLAPESVPLPTLHGVDDRVELCVERANDAIVISIVDPAFEPRSNPADVVPTLDLELARTLALLRKAIAEREAPVIFNGDKPLVLPRSAVRIQSRHSTGDGWFLSEDIRPHKVIDGAAWKEPGADVLLPTFTDEYGVVGVANRARAGRDRLRTCRARCR